MIMLWHRGVLGAARASVDIERKPNRKAEKKIFYQEITKGRNHEEDREPQFRNGQNALRSL